MSYSDNLSELLRVVDEEIQTVDFECFIDLFKRDKDGRIPIPIRKLLVWHYNYPNQIYIIENHLNQQLELCIDRVTLLYKYKVGLKVMQKFERCLMSVKPKLMVIQTTHGHGIKKFTLLNHS